MRCVCTTCLVLLCGLLHAVAAGADGVTREFGLPPNQPNCSGYAEVTLTAQRAGGRAASFRHRIWFDGPSRWRVESSASFNPDLLVYIVHDGPHTYSATADISSKRRPRWYAFPSSWPNQVLLDTYLQSHCTLIHARLVETTSLHGLPAQHWRGVGKTGTTAMDVWVSTDHQFPLVLKWQVRSLRTRSNWEIAKLDLHTPVPAWVFTPQLHPRPGLFALLAMPYWPKWLVLIWYAAFLACLGAFTFSLISKGGAIRIASGTMAGLGALALLWVSPRSAAYSYLLSDTPFQIAILALMAAFVFWVVRKGGWPRGTALFKGTRWTVAVFALAAVLAAAFIAFSRQHMFASDLGVRAFAIPFLPGVLLNALIYCAGWAFLEEFVFRGYLFGMLTAKAWSPRLVNVTQALVFAVYHIPRDVRLFGTGSRLPVDFLYMFAFGLLFGHLRRRYGNLGAPWIVHTCYNVTFFYVLNASAFGIGQAVLSTLR